MWWRVAWLAGVAAVAAGVCVWTGSAGAAGFRAEVFDVDVSNDANGAFAHTAGQPVSISSMLRMRTDPVSGVPTGGLVKDIEVDLPAGFAGDPAAVPGCQAVDLINGNSPEPGCSLDSQVGIAHPATQDGPSSFIVPVFNVVAPPGVAAEFAIKAGGLYTMFQVSARPDDYGLRLRARNIEHALGLMVVGAQITFWGVPADPVHDGQRCNQILYDPLNNPNRLCEFPATSEARRLALLTNPTACTPAGPGLEAKIRVTSYTGASDESSVLIHSPPGYTYEDPLPKDQWGEPQGMTGCDQVPFDPSIHVTADSRRPDSPTGLAIDLSLPQAEQTEP